MIFWTRVPHINFSCRQISIRFGKNSIYTFYEHSIITRMSIGY